jgi:hypothetical protein
MGLITGFIEGTVTYMDGTTPKLLPFQDKVEEASFKYSGELLMSETFSAQGIKGASSACPFSEEASFELMTTNISWSFLQASVGQASSTRTAPIPVSYSGIIDADNELTLPSAPVAGQPITAADELGVQYTVTVTGSTAAFATGNAGKKVTVSYFAAAANGQRELALGKGERLGEFSVYGRFFGCPDTYLIYAKRVVVKPELDLGVGANPASAGMILQCLRDDDGAFAYIIPLS